MERPQLPADESQRQEALERTGLIEKGRDTRFDRITEIAQQSLGVPIALITLIDRDRQWFKSVQGLDTDGTSRDVSFCGHALHQNDALIVEDATADARFADNPLVTGPPHIRFYAGVPIREAGGYPLGTLCIIDTQPGPLEAPRLETLRNLAGLAEELILQDQFQDRNAQALAAEKQQELEQTNRALSLLNHIAFELKGSIEEQIQQALVLGREYLGLDIAIVSDIEDRTYTVRWCDAPPEVPLHPGQTFDLGMTYCDLVMHHGHEIAIHHMRHSLFHDHPCYEAFSLEAYIGTHLQGEERTLGTLNFSSPSPRPHFNDSERLFVRLLSRWIATRIIILDDLMERRKLEAMKSQFIATVSHELRTPLTSIAGSLKLLKSGTAGALPPRAQRLTEVAERNSTRLFQRFAQADGSDTRKQPGTGLGLAITKELMEQMNGRVRYHASPERGAVFTLSLPVTQQASHHEAD